MPEEIREKILDKSLQVEKFSNGERAIIRIDLDHLLAILPPFEAMTEEKILEIASNVIYGHSSRKLLSDEIRILKKLAHALSGKIAKQEEKFCECSEPEPKDTFKTTIKVQCKKCKKSIEPQAKECECPACNPNGNCSNNGICYHCGKPIHQPEKFCECKEPDVYKDPIPPYCKKCGNNIKPISKCEHIFNNNICEKCGYDQGFCECPEEVNKHKVAKVGCSNQIGVTEVCWKCLRTFKPKPISNSICKHDWNFSGTGGTSTSINNDYICKKCGIVKKEVLPISNPGIEEIDIDKWGREYANTDDVWDVLDLLIEKLNEVIRHINKIQERRGLGE